MRWRACKNAAGTNWLGAAGSSVAPHAVRCVNLLTSRLVHTNVVQQQASQATGAIMCGAAIRVGMLSVVVSAFGSVACAAEAGPVNKIVAIRAGKVVKPVTP